MWVGDAVQRGARQGESGKKKELVVAAPVKMKNPEVLLARSSRPAARLLTLADLLHAALPCGSRTARSFIQLLAGSSGSGLATNRINRLTPRDPYLAFDIVFPFTSTSASHLTLTGPPAIASRAFTGDSRLEPRTQHQPDKLKKAVKERVWFYAHAKKSQAK